MIYLAATIILTCISVACVACVVYAPRALRIFRETIAETRVAQTSRHLMEQAERLAIGAIAFAEERARAASKSGRKLTGGAKLNLAIGYFRQHAGERILGLFPRGVGDWLEAKLGMERGMPDHHAEISAEPPLVDTFIPGVGTVRSCLQCYTLVVGGPTRCTPCATGVPGSEDALPA